MDLGLGRLDPWRTVIAVVMVFALVMTLSWLQGRYNASDHEKATTLVKTYRAQPKGPSIPEAIIARNPWVLDHQISWSSEMLSSCLGTVRVTGFVPAKEDHPALTYAFDVRLTDPSIHPTDPATVEILKSLGAPARTATTTATTAAP